MQFARHMRFEIAVSGRFCASDRKSAANMEQAADETTKPRGQASDEASRRGQANHCGASRGNFNRGASVKDHAIAPFAVLFCNFAPYMIQYGNDS